MRLVENTVLTQKYVVDIATLGVTIVCALGNKPAGSKWWYIVVMTIFAALFGSESHLSRFYRIPS